jgi:hypothetical protein
MDSSYDLLKQANRNYNDSFYHQLEKKNGDLKGYCLGYYLFNESQLAFPYFSPRRLIMIN